MQHARFERLVTSLGRQPLLQDRGETAFAIGLEITPRKPAETW